MLPKSVGSCLAEVTEVLSDTELRIKKEFGGESGKTTSRIREKLAELKADGATGLDFKKLPHVDQADMYKTVYKELKDGGCLGIFPEGTLPNLIRAPRAFIYVPSPRAFHQAAATIARTCSRSRPACPSWPSALWPMTRTATCASCPSASRTSTRTVFARAP
jgi:hypothetical protein